MKSSRRQFLACSSVVPFLGLLPPGYRPPEDFYETMEATTAQYRDRKQVFNMCGYSAPAIPHLRVGYIYPGPKGNYVFNAATIFWCQGLSMPPGHTLPWSHWSRPHGPDPRVQQMTANLLRRAGCLP